MSQTDQDLYNSLLESLKLLGVNSPDDLTSLKALWRKRYKEAIEVHSGSKEALNDNLIKIESAYQQLSSIGASELKEILNLSGFLKPSPDLPLHLDINVCKGAATVSIYRSNSEYVVSLITTLGSQDANQFQLFSSVSEALRRLKYRYSKGAWLESRERGFKVIVRSPNTSRDNSVLGYGFWLNLWSLLNQSSHYIYAIEGSLVDSDLFAQVESDLLLRSAGVPPIRDWFSVPEIESQWLGFDPLLSSVLGADTLFRDYIFSLGRGDGIPLSSLLADHSITYLELCEQFSGAMVKLWDRYNYLEKERLQAEQQKQRRIAAEKERLQAEQEKQRRIAAEKERLQAEQEEQRRIAVRQQRHRAAQKWLRRLHGTVVVTGKIWAWFLFSLLLFIVIPVCLVQLIISISSFFN